MTGGAFSSNGGTDGYSGLFHDEVSRATQSLIASMPPIPKQTIDLAKEIRPVVDGMRPFLEEASRVSSLGSASIERLSPILAKLSQLPKIDIELGQFDELRALVEKLYASMPKHQVEIGGVGRERLRRSSVRWGQFGWAIPMHMTVVDLARAPETLEEADRRCMDVYRDGICDLVEHLKENVYARDDLSEAVLLFEEGRYKTCAMVLCALIEGELIKRDPRGREAERRGVRRSSKDTLGLLKPEETDILGYRLNLLGNAIEALVYFFKNANNFDSETEGELNRHFLMHGMMRKPVQKITCVKLFSLLDLTTGYLFQR